jgi:molybdopterin molybdotransferase
MLSAFARDAHLGVAYTAHATDDLDAVVNALDRALDEADVVVTAGGVSVGDYDLIPGALSSLGGETLFHGVDIKPGKPILVGRVRDAWFIGLPGNPVACLVEWRLFIRPLAEALAGDPRAFVEPHLRATLDAPLRNHGSRTLLHPCRLSRRDGGMRAEIRAWKGSHDVAGTASANALLRIEPDADLEAGAAAPVYALPWKDPVLE